MRRDTLYVTDMDGTLLDDEARVSARSAELLGRMSRQGAQITVATARTPASVQVLLSDTGLRLPAIVMTGAALWDLTDCRYSDIRFVGGDAARDIAAEFARHDVHPFTYQLDRDGVMLDVYHTRVMSRAERLFYEPRRELSLKRFIFDEEVEDYGRTVLMFGVGDAVRITTLARVLRQRGDCSVSCYPDTYNPEAALIEVFGAGVTKAEAVRQLAARSGVSRVVVFGDNLNDLTMMSVADEAVAVANAHPDVLAAAHHRIGPNTEDSVALFIEAD